MSSREFCLTNPAGCFSIKRSYGLGLIIVLSVAVVASAGIAIFYYLDQDNQYTAGEDAGYQNGYDEGYADGDADHYTTTGYFTPDIDGLIGYEEWIKSEYVIEQYMDLDNSLDPVVNKSNVDGINYMYVGQDADNFYLALDLCGDRTNNEENEWVSVWLNTKEREFIPSIYDFFGWKAYNNNGTESLCYSLENDELVPFVEPTAPRSIEVIGINTYNNWSEDLESGTYDLFHNSYDSVLNFSDGGYILINSENIGPTNEVLVHYSVNLSQYYPFYMNDEILDDIVDPKINISCVVLQPSPITAVDSVDIDLSELQCTNTTENLVYYSTQQPWNMYMNQFDLVEEDIVDGVIDFTIQIQDNEDPFGLVIDYLALSFNVTAGYNYLYGESTIEDNFEIAWDFDGSSNCLVEHRMIELSIAKSELEGFNETGYLGIYVQGYGTAMFESQYPFDPDNDWGSNSYWFGANPGESYDPFWFFIFYFPGRYPWSPDWSRNYIELTMGIEREIVY